MQAIVSATKTLRTLYQTFNLPSEEYFTITRKSYSFNSQMSYAIETLSSVEYISL